jgi:catechol 2,3-dioxygenase-like lactoylglutathione lyase family enzyme
VGRKPNAVEWELKSLGNQPGAVIYIVRNPAGRAGIPAGGGFVMISVPSVRRAAAKLKAAGYSDIGEPRSNPRYSLLIVRDPDGNQVELISAGEN